MGIRCDSCGAYYRATQLGDRYADISLATAIGISPTGGAGGRACFDLSTGICAVGDATPTSNPTTMSAGCRFKLPALPSTNPFTLIAFWESGGITTHLSMRVNTSGNLEVGRGLSGNVVGTGAQTIQANRWYYAELTMAISATLGSVRAILWDDAGIRYDEIALASQNTRNGGTSGVVSRVYFGPQLVPGGFGASAFLMDLYQVTSGNTWATGLLGPVRVVALQPAADGNYIGSVIAGSSPAATRWQSVQDIPSDEDVTKVTNVISAATKDTYGLPTVTAEDTIWFVQPVLRAKLSATSGVVVSLVDRSSGTDSTIGSGLIVNTTSYKYWLAGGSDTDAAHASVPWTRKTLSAAEFGWSVGSSTLTFSVTQLIVEAVLSDVPYQTGLILADGFDDITTGTSAPSNEFVDGGVSGQFAPTGGVNGKVCSNSQQAAPGVAYNVQPRFRVMMGFKFRYGQNPNQNWLPLCGLSQVVSSSVEKPQLWIGIGTTGKIEVRRGVLATDTLLDNSQNAPTVATWHQVFVDLTIDAAAGAVLIKIDGTTILNLTGLNTVAGAGTTNGRIDRVSLGSGALGATSGNPWSTVQTFGVSFDDWFVLDPAGGHVVDDPGFCTVEAIMPAGAGARSDSTIAGSVPAATRWAGVDEIPPDDGTTFNNFTAALQEDLYTVGPLSGVYTVFGIALRLRAAVSALPAASGASALYAVARLGAGGSDVIAAYSPKSLTSTGMSGSSPKAFDADPSGNPWAYVTLPSLQVGVRRTDAFAANDELTTLAVQVLRSDAVRSPPGAIAARAWVLS